MNQRGHIRKRGKTWSAVWFVFDEEGNRRQRSKGGFETKRKATAHLNGVLADLADGTYLEPKMITYAKFIREHWYPSLDVKPTTEAGYRFYMDRWVLPRLGTRMLPQITPAHIQALYDDLRKHGSIKDGGELSPTSVQHAAVVIRMSLDFALHQEFIHRNPAQAVKRPRRAQKEMAHWSPEEATEFLEATLGDRLYCAWLLFLTRGFRRGEIAGLRWKDVDLETARINVAHTRVLSKGNPITSTPKTNAGRRSVPLDDDLVEAIRTHRRHQLEERLKAGEVWADSGYVFVQEDGNPIRPEYFSTRFKRLARRHGLREIRMHDTRHTAASLALQAHIPSAVVSEWLGHSSVSITQDIYQHVIPSMSEEAGAKLTEIVMRSKKRAADGEE